jgi:hypothetical protein
MMGWDRRTFVNHAVPEQIPKILHEMSTVTKQAEAQQVNRVAVR